MAIGPIQPDRFTEWQPKPIVRPSRVAGRERGAELDRAVELGNPVRDTRAAAKSCAPVPVSRSTMMPAGGGRRNDVSIVMLVPTQSRSKPSVSSSIPARVFAVSTPGQR